MTIQKRVWVAVMRRSEDDIEVLLGLRGSTCGNPHTWGLFGGGVDEGEDLTEAAFREMLEETGVNLKDKDGTLAYIGKSGRLFGDKELHWFIYGAGDIRKKDCTLTEETVDYKWVTLKGSSRLPLHYSANCFFQGMKDLQEGTPYKAPLASVDLGLYLSVK